VILDEQQTMIRDVARQFARQRLAPHAARWDRESHFPMEEIREMGRLGLMGINVPVEGRCRRRSGFDGSGARGNRGRRRRDRDRDERAQFGRLHADCQFRQ
jgi:alkylation response protein AidB-like acyl-CoA dehydrogenase